MPVYEFSGKQPRIGQGTWIAPSAEVVGAVTIGSNCYIGFGAVIRADFGTITIGEDTAVEEGVIIHEAENVHIGNRVIIGHMAMIHDARIDDEALIGMQAMLCDETHIGQSAIIAEKSLILKKSIIPPEEIFGGVPARKIGRVTEAHKKIMKWGQQLYAELPQKYTNTFKPLSPQQYLKKSFR